MKGLPKPLVQRSCLGPCIGPDLMPISDLSPTPFLCLSCEFHNIFIFVHKMSTVKLLYVQTLKRIPGGPVVKTQVQSLVRELRSCLHACEVALAMSDSLRPHGLERARLLCLWDSPGKNTDVGCHFLLEGIFLTQGSNPNLLCFLQGQADSLPPGKPPILTLVIIYYIQVFPIKTIRLLKISQQYFNAHFINKETIPRF